LGECRQPDRVHLTIPAGVRDTGGANPPGAKVFLLLFFSKKEGYSGFTLKSSLWMAVYNQPSAVT
jgi:hypothetical protein